MDDASYRTRRIEHGNYKVLLAVGVVHRYREYSEVMFRCPEGCAAKVALTAIFSLDHIEST